MSDAWIKFLSGFVVFVLTAGFWGALRWVKLELKLFIQEELKDLSRHQTKQHDELSNNMATFRTGLGSMVELVKLIDFRQKALANALEKSKAETKETILASHESLVGTMTALVENHGKVKWEK